GLNWSLYRLERNYQWYRDSYSWRYEATVNTRLVADGQIDILSDSGARISTPVEWGRYRLEVESPDAAGPASSVVFNAGYFSDGNPAETPDALEVALDKDSYRAGETAKLKISPRFSGEVLVVVGGDRFFETMEASIPAEGGEIDIPVNGEWGAGAYVTATLLRPGSAEKSRMPMRAIGTSWLSVEPGSKELSVSVDLPEKTQPDSTLSVPVKVAGGVEGENIYATIAMVDVGILNLTRHEAPDPADWYFGQRQLGLEIRDIYGRLIDGSAGAFGRVRTGGDGPGLTAKGSPPTEKLLALYSGIIELDQSGEASVDFDIPQFNGTARLMAVAWSKSAVGSAEQEIVIRDPIVLQASLPKVMAPGDEAISILEIANTDGPTGDYSLTVAASDELSIGSIPAEITLSEGERRVLKLPISASKSGNAQVTITASLGTDILVSRTQFMKVRPSTLPVANRFEIPLAANGGSIQIDEEVLGQSIVEGSTVSINVSRTAGFDVASLLMKLDRYPYGCAEQTTSRALPLLYLSEFDAPEELLDTPEIGKRISGAIERVLSYQSSSGAFGLWGPGDSDFWLDAYVTDFLTRAQEKSHPVPEQAMRLALANLQNKLGYQNNISEDGDAMAYALYVLARNRMASAGDLRYYADTRLAEFSSPLARAHIAAALSLYNDPERSSDVFLSSFDLVSGNNEVNLLRTDYGSNLRDGAAILALATETKPVTTIVPGMIDVVENILEQKRFTSTQENAWMLLAARAAQEANKSLELRVDGKSTTGAYSNQISGEKLIGNPIEIGNESDQPLTAIVTALASPIDPLPAGGEGFTIEREYYHLDGNPAQMIEVSQNDRFVVVLRVNELNAIPSRVLVTDLLPGGFEIENPRIVDSATLKNFGWLGETYAAHSEFRDDRFVAAFNRNSNSNRNIFAAYMVRAVTPGRYSHPAASVEDMYRPEFSASTASGFIDIKPVQ
ncbi:MAG: alpha-2-macroglobulin family protein, partial [Rhizobiaceae bacterium]